MKVFGWVFWAGVLTHGGRKAIFLVGLLLAGWWNVGV